MLNIQMFMGKKNFDCQKAERWFKERRLQVQLVDLKRKPLSKGEFDSVAACVGIKNMIDVSSKTYLESPARFSIDPMFIKGIVFENQALLLTPIVRFGKRATAGYCPEVWETWLESD